MKRVIVALFLLVSSSIASFAYAPHSDSVDRVKLTVVVENIKNDDGDILIGIYDKYTETYEIEECYVGDMIKARNGSISTVFSVAKGRYAIFSIHDEDSNKFLNKNLFKIPSEPYAISNGIRFPNWERSLVSIERDITVKLKLK